MRSQQGGPKAVICPLSVSEYLLSREDHKKPAFAGVSYLFKKRAIVALFALSSEFNSNCLKPNFCSTKRTIASLVISTFFPFFAFSILFLLNIEHIIQTFLKISIGKSKKDELFLGDKCSLCQIAPILSHFDKLVKRKFKFLLIIYLGKSFATCRPL